MDLFPTNKAIAELSFRLGELTTEVENLKSKNKHLELEWEELYDKVRHQMSRMSRRFATEQKELGNGAELPAAPDEEEGMDPISAKIHERRSRGHLKL